MNTKLSTSTTTGSTLSPGLSSVYSRSIVLELPPAPAARVLVGLALAIFSFWSAAARRRIAVRAPPGAAGDEGRLTPVLATGAPRTGDEGRGDDYKPNSVIRPFVGVQELATRRRCVDVVMDWTTVTGKLEPISRAFLPSCRVLEGLGGYQSCLPEERRE
jgi:hypothetical protein